VTFFLELIIALHRYSTWPEEDFVNENNNEHRHRIWFPQTSEPEGFAGAPGIDPDQLGFLEPWQFSICRESDWRVHGFIVDGTFYVVWLDPNHALYPRPVLCRN
jgi:hypothetical protein